MAIKRRNVNDILREYGAKLDSEINTSDEGAAGIGNYSQEYIQFKEEMAPEITRYERWCRSLGNIIRLNVAPNDAQKIQKQLSIAHVDLEPWQPLTLAVMAFLSIFFIGLLISVAILFISGSLPILFFLLVIMLSVFVFYYMKNYPARLANKWRLKASSQMVPAILYVVVYMRHTSNLERAISFAADHLQYPLALDFKKVFYDVQVGKFATIKESLDNYLQIWQDYSIEFIEAFHLIESSLYEPDDAKRISTLEKSLQVVLDGVYDKMLKFTHEVKSPLTNVYMLGVVLPTLGLALLPLATAMLGGMLTWVHIFILFDLIVPFLVFYLTDKILFMRPGGYGEASLIEKNPLYYEYKSKTPYINAFILTLPLFILGLLPFIVQYTSLPAILGLQKDYNFAQIGLGVNATVIGFTPNATHTGFVGPFGVGALILSMFIPLGIAMFFSLSFKARTKDLIVARNKTKQLEDEFNTSLFQLGNRIGNGTPPEIAFGEVAEVSQGLQTRDFFNRVNYNIRQLGMSVEKAIFDRRQGAIIFFPSELIATSMRILVESAKKGLRIAAISLMSISEYVKNIQKITERLKDMLAEVVSDMKSNMSFLAPLLSGVVVGLASMINAILYKVNQVSLQGVTGATLGGVDVSTLSGLFDFTQMIPPYFLQIIIGIYLIEIVFILTRTLVTINSGEDKLEVTNETGKNLIKGIMLYFITGLVATVALSVLVGFVLKGLG